MQTLAIKAAGTTDIGLVREENQDTIFVSPAMDLYLVLDGMGGHQGGATASQTSCRVIADIVERGLNRREPAALLIEACKAAGARVHQDANRNRELHGMGTTVVAVLLPRPDLAVIAHVGDSRVYLMRDRRLRRLTADHTVVAELVAQGKLTPDQAINHPHASVLSRNLGGLPTTDVEVSEVQLKSGDRLLLCSDGLNGYSTQGAIEQVLGGAEDAQSATEDLIELAKRGGGGDNVSAVVIEVGTQTPGPRVDVLQDTGGKAWWLRRRLFMNICDRMGISDSPLAAGLNKDESLELLAGSFCEAVYHDLENASGVHVWTYSDSLAQTWFDRGGGYHAIQEIFDILRAGSLAVVKDVSTSDENFAVCLEIALLRALIVGEMVVGGQLGARIKEASEKAVAGERTTELPLATFASIATVPFESFSSSMPAPPEVSRCLRDATEAARTQIQAARFSLLGDILTACHAVADEFSGDGEMIGTATELYGTHLLTEQELTPLLDALDTCRHAHLSAIDKQQIAPEARATAYRAAALAHQSLFHAMALAAVDAGKPTTDELQTLTHETALMREKMSKLDERLAELEGRLDTAEEMKP